MRKNALYWIPALLCAALIFWFSHQSQPPAARVVPDYLGHLLGYAGFTLTLVWGMSRGFRVRLQPRGLFQLGVFAALYGVSDEFHQFFIPGRVASVADVMSDVAGSILCLVLVYLAGERGGP